MRFSARYECRSCSTSTWWRSAVNRSSPSRLAASRTRSNACDTLSRPWVRCLLCRAAFPSASPLPATGSATGFPALFVGFPGTTEESDCSRPGVIGFGLFGLPDADRPIPWDGRAGRPGGRSPGFRAKSFHACLGSTTTQGRRGHSPWRTRPCCLPHSPTGSAPRMCILSRLDTQPTCTPVNASPTPSRGPPHDSGPVCVASPSPRTALSSATPRRILPAHGTQYLIASSRVPPEIRSSGDPGTHSFIIDCG